MTYWGAAKMKILVVGAGGIGSWLIPRLARLDQYRQLGDCSLVVADYDEVETKNLPYQNFELDEILDSKAMCLDARYDVIGQHEKIETHDQLRPFDIIMCAVDNPKLRRLVYEHCDGDEGKYFIDLRSEGTAVWGITSDAGWTLDQLNATLGSDDEEDRSCQLKYQLDAGIIELGNPIIAEIGAQWLLNRLRNKANSQVYSQRF